MGFFRKTEYIDEIIPEMKGYYESIEVTIKNMQCRREKETTKRKYPYSNFGSDLIYELFGKKKITYQNIKQELQQSGNFTLCFNLRQLPEITIEIRGTIPPKEREFESNFADALIDAWERNNIKP